MFCWSHKVHCETFAELGQPTVTTHSEKSTPDIGPPNFVEQFSEVNTKECSQMVIKASAFSSHQCYDTGLGKNVCHKSSKVLFKQWRKMKTVVRMKAGITVYVPRSWPNIASWERYLASRWSTTSAWACHQWGRCTVRCSAMIWYKECTLGWRPLHQDASVLSAPLLATGN